MMNKSIIMPICFCLALSGCFSGSFRSYTIVSTDDFGDRISTKYRYKIKDAEGLFHLMSGYDDQNNLLFNDKSYALKRVMTKYPYVFSDSGIPVAVKISSTESWVRNRWTLLLTIFSVTLFPEINSSSVELSFDVMIADDVETRDYFSIKSAQDSARGIFPTALIPFGGMPDCGAKRVYGQSDTVVGSDTAVCNYRKRLFKQNSGFYLEGFAYGVVAKLKAMEDSGKIDAMLQRLEAAKLQRLEAAKLRAPAHRVVRLVHDAESDFACRFTLELLEMPLDPDKAKVAVLKEFGESLKEEYVGSVCGAKQMALAVNYTDVKMDGKLIHGRASVLAMSLVSLSYDASTRYGKLSVRFNAGQDKEAREWIRKNIETLARDKNIALVTGQLPPAATYYSLSEKVDGNVMTIEFRTE